MAWIAPIAAAAKRRREEEEERRMIDKLKREAPDDRFEYKVLRSHFGAFGSRERQRRALKEEARAGWEMAAKLDSDRLMLRRDRSEISKDQMLWPEIDPYRTEVDSPFPIVIGVGVVLLIGALALLLTLGGSSGSAIGPLAIGIAVIGLLVLVAAMAARRR